MLYVAEERAYMEIFFFKPAICSTCCIIDDVSLYLSSLYDV